MSFDKPRRLPISEVRVFVNQGAAGLTPCMARLYRSPASFSWELLRAQVWGQGSATPTEPTEAPEADSPHWPTPCEVSQAGGLPDPWTQALHTEPAECPELPSQVEALSQREIPDPLEGLDGEPLSTPAEAVPCQFDAASADQGEPAKDTLLTTADLGRPLQATERPARAASVVAIVRSIEEASTLHGVAELVGDYCNGERNRRAGPWCLAVPLGAHGLADTVMHLNLSLGALSLRFVCGDKSAHNLLSTRVQVLHQQLQDTLEPPLAISIDID